MKYINMKNVKILNKFLEVEFVYRVKMTLL